MEKVCCKCKISKPHSEFTKVKNPAKGDRYGLTSRCKPCRAAYNNAYNKSNTLRTKENCDRWYSENVEYSRYRAKAWREANRGKHATNNKIWKAKNPSKNTANTARYKSKKLSATPLWLDAIQLAQIEEFYDIAVCRTMQTGVQHHVDHIIPLQGNGVSGLHVPWNLQVLTAFENISKKNKMIEVSK